MTVETTLQWMAVVSAGLFAGGALYVSVAEHPGRMEAGISAALAEFRPSYHRAAPWQALMAIVASVCGIGATLLTSDWVWAVGGMLVGAAIPLTLIAILPINDRLLDPDVSDPEAEVLFKRWGRLHLVRSVLGAAGMLVLVSNVLRG